MKIEIQVQGGRVTITVGGQKASTASNAGQIKQQSAVGAGAFDDPGTGGGAFDDPGTGGGGPGSGALVIGPIVVDCCMPGKGSKTGGGAFDDPGTGGGAFDDPGTGGGGPSSGVVVIGPIVVGGSYGGAGTGGKNNPPPQTISVSPNE